MAGRDYAQDRGIYNFTENKREKNAFGFIAIKMVFFLYFSFCRNHQSVLDGILWDQREWCEILQIQYTIDVYCSSRTSKFRISAIHLTIAKILLFPFIFSAGRAFNRFEWFVRIQWFFGRRHCWEYASLYIAFFGRHFGASTIVQRTFNIGKGFARRLHWASSDDGITFSRHKRTTRFSQSFSTWTH